jgi:NADH:ubiquinone oxidoreductase subunit D
MKMEAELSILNLGPTHPATHGIFQNVLMDGERIFRSQTNHGLLTYTLLKKLQKTDLLPNNSLQTMNYAPLSTTWDGG